jgi:signal peptidase I
MSRPAHHLIASKSTVLATILEYFELFLTCLAAILLLFTFDVRVCNVDGDSMLPTLHNGERLITWNLFYEPSQGDIIIFHQTSDVLDSHNAPFVKRVIATEGQHVRIDFAAKTVSVDGVELTEDYIQLVNAFGVNIDRYTLFANHNTTGGVFEATVPDGHLFVMGDNRNNSSDSRSTMVGFVDERRVLGRAVFRISPFSEFGIID